MLKAEWAAMSEEERLQFTEERFKEFEAQRKTKAIGKHTLAVNAFRDVSDTLMKVETVVSDEILSLLKRHSQNAVAE